MLTRVQHLVLGFFALAWLGLLAILATMPEIVDKRLHLAVETARRGEAAFLVFMTAFLALLAIGVVRRWRWTFWLIVIAFLTGVLRIPVAVLQLSNVVPAEGPPWYEVLQASIGLIQFALGLMMFAGHRTGGPWGRRDRATRK